MKHRPILSNELAVAISIIIGESETICKRTLCKINAFSERNAHLLDSMEFRSFM